MDKTPMRKYILAQRRREALFFCFVDNSLLGHPLFGHYHCVYPVKVHNATLFGEEEAHLLQFDLYEAAYPLYMPLSSFELPVVYLQLCQITRHENCLISAGIDQEFDSVAGA